MNTLKIDTSNDSTSAGEYNITLYKFLHFDFDDFFLWIKPIFIFYFCFLLFDWKHYFLCFY